MEKLKKITRFIFITFTFISLIIYTYIAYRLNDFSHIGDYYKFTFFILLLFVLSEYIYTKKLKFLPTNLFYIAAIFFFCANSLGELNNFYERFYWWDDILHLISGILIDFAMISLIDFFVSHIFIIPKKNIAKYMNFLIFTSALCSISLGIFWEFYEYTADHITDSNMQDGLLLTTHTSYDEIAPYVKMDNNRVLDKALEDTMNDLFLSTVGATLASAITYFYAFKRKVLIFPLTNNYKRIKDILKRKSD